MLYGRIREIRLIKVGGMSMKAKYNLIGQTVGYVITMEEMEIFRKLARQAKGSKTKFDALTIFRENNLLEE